MTNTSNKTQQEFLGKKVSRLSDLIDKNKMEDDEDPNSSEEEEEKYKDLFSGKLNVRNALMEEINNKEAKWSPEDYDKLKSLQKEKEENKTNKKMNKEVNKDILTFLPAPKKKFVDKMMELTKDSQKKLSSLKFQNLACPDSLMINADDIKNSEANFQVPRNEDTTALRQSELLDENWERKYITDKELKKDFEDNEFNFTDVASGQRNKNNIRSVIADYKKEKEIEKIQNAKPKYGKLTPKQKYGW
jgi:hypothetical protein